MADVSILDIAGSQWDFKDMKAREMLARNNMYSLTEINTGKTWIDGKPIYRKVFDNSNFTTTFTIQNIKMLIHCEILALDGIRVSPYYYESSGQVRFIVGTNKITLEKSGNWVNSWGKYLIFEYTKTTD